jgi:hypothetical protein
MFVTNASDTENKNESLKVVFLILPAWWRVSFKSVMKLVGVCRFCH